MTLDAFGGLGGFADAVAGARDGGARFGQAVPLGPTPDAPTVVLFSSHRSLFGEEDRLLLTSLGQQAAGLVERREAILAQQGLADRLSSTVEALRSASQAKSDFLASMSHELRTPLNAIIGFSDLMRRETPDDEGNVLVPLEWVEHIRRGGTHLVELVNDVLDLSRVEAGRLELDPRVDRGPAGGRRIGRRAPPARRSEGAGHRARHRARRARRRRPRPAAPGPLQPPLERHQVHPGRRPDHDRGRPQTAISITSRSWTRASASPRRTRRSSSTSSARSAAAASAARAAAWAWRSPAGSSRPTAAGSSSSRRRASAAGSRSSCRRPRSTRRSPRTRGGPPMPSPRSRPPPASSSVLVVEDDPSAVRLLKAYLEPEGYRVRVAPDGEQALLDVRAERPAAILLDVLLPGMDGWEVLRRLKADPDLRDIPVVIVTVVDEKDVGLALGAVDYIVKPIDRDALLGSLGRIGLLPILKTRTVRILAVDDEPAALDMLSETLRPAGFDVVRADGGMAAIAMARAERPDLVICDLVMPDLDGFGVVAALKADPATAAIPIIILTGYDLTAADKRRLNGKVLRIVSKGADAQAGLRAWLIRADPLGRSA